MNDSHTTWTAVDTYFNNLLLPADQYLDVALSDAAEAGMPMHNVSPSQGQLIALLMRMHQSKSVLEIGTLGGYSTIWIARALPEGGRVISLEIDPTRAEVARKSIARAGLDNKVEIITGAAVDTLPTLAAKGYAPFDFIFIDADKPSNPIYLEWALKLSRAGTVIFADNVVRNGAVTNADSDDANVKGVQQFTELIAKETRLSATAIQTVGEKGYDGFILAIVQS
ncbi:O-methyltransferase [Mucilaginibacter calamicampi]|uniref:O-methyltransferase n=1 Tax=Mucilaginibacter calamicampi TaxID=1302352 RepID=A0ABW2YWG6_9SPHI